MHMLQSMCNHGVCYLLEITLVIMNTLCEQSQPWYLIHKHFVSISFKISQITLPIHVLYSRIIQFVVCMDRRI